MRNLSCKLRCWPTIWAQLFRLQLTDLKGLPKITIVTPWPGTQFWRSWRANGKYSEKVILALNRASRNSLSTHPNKCHWSSAVLNSLMTIMAREPWTLLILRILVPIYRKKGSQQTSSRERILSISSFEIQMSTTSLLIRGVRVSSSHFHRSR